MANASKNKGKGAERELCKIFSTVFGGSWMRTFTSGAFTGMSNNWRANVLSKSQLLNNSNDIVPPDEYPYCALESKAYKEFEFHHLYRDKGNLTLNGWIDQVEESGIDMVKSFPMICFKINRMGWFACCWSEKISDLDYSNLNHTNYIYNNKKFVIFELDKFITTFTDDLKKKFSD
jgi:hypothetical protein